MIIRKLFKAEMAHNVPGAYTARCHYLHGHSYKFELFLKSSQPNPAQMVADFKGIKEMGINDFFDSFDHTVTMWDKDALVSLIGKINPERHLIVPFIPTAEMLAKACFVVCQTIVETAPKLSNEKDVSVERVIVHETDTGYASFESKDLENDQFPSVDFSRWKFSQGIISGWKNKSWYDHALKISLSSSFSD